MAAPTRESTQARAFERSVFRRLRRLCLALPETKETSSWGHPNFRAGRRTFCAFELFAGRPSVALRLAATDAKRFARKKHFFATPYGRGVWVSRWLDVDVDSELLAGLIDRSYRQVAPDRLIRLLDVGKVQKPSRQSRPETTD